MKLAGFLNVEYFASLIVTAFRTSAVGHLFLVTVGTFGEAVAFQSIVSPPRRGAFLGVSPLWIRHGIEFLVKSCRLSAINFDLIPIVRVKPDLVKECLRLTADSRKPRALSYFSILSRISFNAAQRGSSTAVEQEHCS